MAVTRRLALTVILVVIILTSTGLPVLAQARATTADLSGTVFDQSKAVVAGATVTATNVATLLERTAVSQRDGRYSIPALPPGAYTVEAALLGFATQVVENVSLTLGQVAELDFTLQVGGASQTVTVVAGSPSMDPLRTAVSTVVSQRQIDQLPINGRDFISFSVITPAVSTDRVPQQGAGATSGLTFAGQRARSNNIMVDGLDNIDITHGSVPAILSQEAVQEFQVIANSYSAEFGKASGGVVNIVTKSGGNRAAGSAFLFGRDDALNAREHFEKFSPAGERIDQGKAPYGQYQFGGTVGGPIRRNRSFFFLSAERLRVRANNFVNIDETEPVVVFGRNYGTVVDILRRAGFPVEVGHVPYRVESDQVLAKVDTSVTSNHRLVLRFNWADRLDENVEPWGGQVARSRGAYLKSRDFVGAASLTSVFASRAVNELRFQVANHDQKVISLDPTCSGGVCDEEAEGGPTLEIGAIAVGRQRFTPQPRETRRYQVVDTFSYKTGQHHLRTGLDFSYVDHRSVAFPLHFGGRYIFWPLPAIPPLGLPEPVGAREALALGLPAAYVQGYGNASLSSLGYSDISVFAEDDWRVTDRVTLKLGVRYQNQFWQEMIEQVPGLPPYGWPTDNNNVAPRLGLSWNPSGDKKTYVRGSYGVFYDNHITALRGITAIISGTPEAVRTRVVKLTDPDPAGPVAAWGTPGRRLPEPAAPYPSLVLSIDPGLRTPYAHHVSVGLERRLAGDLTMSTRFVYVRGFDLTGSIDYNPVTKPPNGRPLDVNGEPGTSATVWQYTSWGETWYRGLILSLGKRFGGRSEFLASYTLSKAEDTTTDFAYSGPQDAGLGRNPDDPKGLPLGFNPDLEKGPSLQDQRHRLVLSGAYTLPGGITVSSIVTLASGRPFNILAGADLNRDGDGGSGPTDRARRNRADPATSVGRNTGLLPSQYTVDLRVAKRLDLGGRAKIDLMVEMFNLFNRTNYTEVDNVFGEGAYPDGFLPTFGQFTKAAPPFQAQLGAKIIF